MDTEHVGQPLDGGNLLGCGHDTDGVHPTAGANLLGCQCVDTADITGVERVVALVVEVCSTLLVTLDGLGIEIGVGVEGSTCLVGQEHPIDILGRQRESCQQEYDKNCDTFHFLYIVLFQYIM